MSAAAFQPPRRAVPSAWRTLTAWCCAAADVRPAPTHRNGPTPSCSRPSHRQARQLGRPNWRQGPRAADGSRTRRRRRRGSSDGRGCHGRWRHGGGPEARRFAGAWVAHVGGTTTGSWLVRLSSLRVASSRRRRRDGKKRRRGEGAGACASAGRARSSRPVARVDRVLLTRADAPCRRACRLGAVRCSC
eukprot:366390-Chlamydomonas_euryale.AAC.14